MVDEKQFAVDFQAYTPLSANTIDANTLKIECSKQVYLGAFDNKMKISRNIKFPIDSSSMKNIRLLIEIVIIEPTDSFLTLGDLVSTIIIPNKTIKSQKVDCLWFDNSRLYNVEIPIKSSTFSQFQFSPSPTQNSQYAFRNFTLIWERVDNSMCGMSCLKCNSINPLICQQCMASSNKELIDNQCYCKDGYYDNLNEDCQTNKSICSKTCKQCDPSKQSNCLSCDSSHNRQLINSKCICQDGFYQKPQELVCQKCNSPCLKCDFHPDYCTACNNGRTLQNNQCICPKGSFIDTNSQCLKCQIQNCEECSGSQICTKCISESLLIVNGKCACQEGYIYSQEKNTCLVQCQPGTIFINNECKQCDKRCKTCSDSISKCDSCFDNFTQELTLKGECKCKQQFYETTKEDGSFNCSQCEMRCKTCDDGTSCTTCFESDGFVLDKVGKKCQCQEGRYQTISANLTLICVDCNEKCQTCELKSDHCLECKKGRDLILIQERNICECKQGWYYNQKEKSCKECKKSCSLCTEYHTCQKCSDENIYQLNPSTNNCDCKEGYYIDETNVDICVPCSDMCKTCSYYNQCNSCKYADTKLNIMKECVCGDREYFDFEVTKKCKKCLFSCGSCMNDKTCIECINYDQYVYDQQQEKCFCKEGLYLNNQLCIPCPKICKTCLSEGVCTKCIDPSMVITFGKCECPLQTYYDSQLNKCLPCSKNCKICSNQNSCQSCIDDESMELYGITEKTCICKSDGFFEDQNGKCTKCEYTCSQCLNSTSCSSCKYPDTFIGEQSNSFCGCKVGLNFDRVTNKCAQCLSGCKICGDKLECKECTNPVTHILDPIIKQCLCNKGYFSDNNKICKPCGIMCSECKGNQNFCTQCSFSEQTILDSQTGKCLCKNERQFFNLDTKSCESCSLYCNTCDNAQTCLKCRNDVEYSYNPQNQVCDCAIYYYEDAQTKLCSKCIYPNLILDSRICIKNCPNDYVQFKNICQKECPNLYINVQGVCIQSYCDPKVCKKCSSNKIDCLSCIQGFNLMKNHSCKKCDDEEEFYNSKLLQCDKCDSACIGCKGSTSLDCIQCSFARDYLNLDKCLLQCREYEYPFSISYQLKNIIVTEKQCKYCYSHDGECRQDRCKDRYYNAYENICKKCHPTCLSCKGSSKNMCLSCDDTLNLEKGRCLKCSYGFYENKSNQTCEQCHYTCDECNGPNINQCISCNFSLKFSKLSNQCLSVEQFKKEIDEKKLANQIGCLSDDFSVCKDMINYSKQSVEILNTVSISSICFTSVVGLILPSVSFQSWNYIQNHQLLGNLRQSSMVIPYGIIDNHLKVSEDYNLISFFTSLSKKKNTNQEDNLEENLIPDNDSQEDKLDQRILQDQKESKNTSSTHIIQNEIFIQKCLIQICIIGFLNIMIIILHFLSPRYPLAMRFLGYFKWSLLIRSWMLLSNQMLYSGIEEIISLNFSTNKNILSFAIAVISLALYLFLYIYCLKFLIFSNNFADGQLRSEFIVIYQSLKEDTRVQRMFWIFFELKKLIIILTQVILIDNQFTQLVIIITVSAVFLSYIVISRPTIQQRLLFSCFVLELGNLVFFSLILTIYQNPHLVYLAKILTYSLMIFEGVVLTLTMFQILLKLLEFTKSKQSEKIKQCQEADASQIIGFKVDINIESFLSKQHRKQNSFKSPTKLILKAKFMEMEKV